MDYDLVIIGGGPAGLAAAIKAKEKGVESILIIERGKELGGILNQCIHNGFGLHIFKEELTGPEYAEIFIDRVKELNIEYKLNTFVLEINKDKKLLAMNPYDGLIEINSKAIILAMGCRERPRGAINIPGTRPSGIYTAGTAQRFINVGGYMVGKKVVILGSGDIGLIMARRMTLEGAKVEAVAEIMPYPNGLKRNIAQCLEDFDIPLLLEHTVVDIKGKDRVEEITLAQVDKNRNIVPGTEKCIECDTLVLSVGLIPENELSRDIGVDISPITSGPIVNESLETNIEGVFACGNVLHVHDLVDNVTQESYRAGEAAAKYIQNNKPREEEIVKLNPGKGVRYVLPQYINISNLDENNNVFLRVDNIYDDMKLAVATSETKIKEIKKKKLLPAEMESINLKKEELLDLNSDEIFIYLE